MRFQTPKDKEIWDRRRRENKGLDRDRQPPRGNQPTRDTINDFRRSMAGDGGPALNRASRSHSPFGRAPINAPVERATLKAPRDPEIILADSVDGGDRLRGFLRHGLIFVGLGIIIAVQGGLLIAALRDDRPELDPTADAALRDGGAGPASHLDVAQGRGAAGPLFEIDPVQSAPTMEPQSAPAAAPEPETGPLPRVAEAVPGPEVALRGADSEQAPKLDSASGGGLQIAPELDIAQPEGGAERPPELDLPEPAAGPATLQPDAAPARPPSAQAASEPQPAAAPTEVADAAPSALQPAVALNEVAARALAQLVGEAGTGLRKAPSPQPAGGPIELVTFAPEVMPTHDGASQPEAGPAPAETEGVGKAATAAMPRSGTGPRELSVAPSTPSQGPVDGPMQAPHVQIETEAEPPERSFETAARSGVATTGSQIVNTGIPKEAERIGRQATTAPRAGAQSDAPQAVREAKERIEDLGRPQGRSAAASSQATADPSALSAARLRAPADGSPTGAQTSRAAPFQPDLLALQAATDLETPGSAAGLQVASEPSFGDRPAAPADDIRVFIHHVADRQGDATLAGRLADHLRTRGFTVVDIRPVDFSIGKPSVRYFFARDRAASRRLVDELGRFFEETPSRAPGQASDFTHFVPKPRPGNVEVWLPVS